MPIRLKYEAEILKDKVVLGGWLLHDIAVGEKNDNWIRGHSTVVGAHHHNYEIVDLNHVPF